MEDRPAFWPALLLIPALALTALAYAPWLGLSMVRTTYVRELLLAVLAAPALAAGLAALGPRRGALALALSGGPARLFLLAVWGQAALAWASTAWARDPSPAAARAMELTALAAWGTGWLLAASSSDTARRRLLAGHLCVGALIAAVGLAAHLAARFGGGSPPSRLGDPIGNPNTVAVLMFFPLAGAAALLMRGGRWKVEGGGCGTPQPGASTFHLPPSTAAAVLVALLSLVVFVLTGSRTGMVGLAAAALFLTAVHVRPKWRMIGAAALALAAAASLLWLTADQARMTNLWEAVRLGSIGPRYFGTIAGWGIFSEHPVLGAGADSFLAEAPAHLPPEHYLGSYGDDYFNLAHNEYAQTAAEGGLVGLALLLALLASVTWGGLRGARTGLEVGGGRREAGGGSCPPNLHPDSAALSLGLAAAAAGVAVSSLGDPSLRLWDFTAFFWAAAGLAVAGPSAPQAATGTEPPSAGGAVERGLGKSQALLLAAGLGAAVMVTALVAMPEARREEGMRRAQDAEARGDFDAASLDYARVVHGPGPAVRRLQARAALVKAAEFAARRASTPEAAREFRRVSLAEAESLCATMPECPINLRRLAAARLSSGDRAGALGALVMAARRDPFDRDFRMRFLRVLAAEPEATRRALAASVGDALRLPDGDRAMLLSMASAAGRDWPGAVAAVNGLAPETVAILPLEFWRGLCLAEAGRFAEALATMDRHLAIEPLHANGWFWRARVLRAAGGPGNAEGAMASLRRCVGLDAEDDEARLELAGMLLDAGRPAEAVELLRPRLAASPKAVDCAIVTARALRQLGRQAEAEALLKDMLRRTGDGRVRAALEQTPSSGR